ncbi:hypothetical protein K440DRAFT_618425 [Wilcoxina mikolae CBS 423.85]|nr:hypothetical protein K440DRAFT_618425 [Wilcoxina mikolae CBS 423.85]
MLRLHPSSIVPTHEEINRVLDKPCPPASQRSSSFTSYLSWDHVITVRRQRRKGKQRASTILDHDILSHFQALSINQDEDHGYNGGTEEDVGDAGDEGDEGSITPSPVIDGSPRALRASDTQVVDQLSSDNFSTATPEHEAASSSHNSTQLSLSHIDGAFSLDDFDTPNWVIYEDPETLSENDEANDVDYLADIEQDLSGASDYQGEEGVEDVDIPEHLPLRPLVARHLDGAAEIEPFDSEIVDEELRYPYSPGPVQSGSPHLSLPLPSSLRLQSRLSGTLEGPTRLEAYQQPNEPTGVHDNHHNVGSGSQSRWLSAGVRRSLRHGLDRDGNWEIFRRRRRISGDGMNTASVEDFSDDSLSGIQLPPDTVAVLEERRYRRQMEAARRTIR